MEDKLIDEIAKLYKDLFMTGMTEESKNNHLNRKEIYNLDVNALKFVVNHLSPLSNYVTGANVLPYAIPGGEGNSRFEGKEFIVDTEGMTRKEATWVILKLSTIPFTKFAKVLNVLHDIDGCINSSNYKKLFISVIKAIKTSYTKEFGEDHKCEVIQNAITELEKKQIELLEQYCV